MSKTAEEEFPQAKGVSYILY